MVKIRFETGQVVNFEGTPTKADIDEVAKNLKQKSGLQKIGSALKTGLKTGLEDVRTEGISPILSGLSTAAFGAPRAAIRDPLRGIGFSTEQLRKFAPEMAEKLQATGRKIEESVLPEQRTFGGKVLRGASELRGLAKGEAAKLAGKITRPGAVGTGLRFGTFGATQLEKDPTLKGQAEKGLTFGTLGLVGGAAAPKSKEIISKLKSDFINSKLVPRVKEIFSKTLEKFPEPMQKYAIKTAKIPEKIVKYISRRTPNGIRQSAQALDDNADNIFVGMEQKIGERGKQVTEAYGSSLKNVGNIDINKSVSQMEVMLKKHGFIDSLGNMTSRVKDPLADPVLKTIAGEFQALRGISGAGTTAAQRTTGTVNRYVWENLKDRLSQLNARGGKLSPDITKILDALHLEAEKAGATGIQNARSLARELFRKQSIAKKFIDEKKIEKMFKLTGEESRSFQELDKYLGGGFEQKAKDLMAGRSLKSLESLSESQVFGQESKLIGKLKEARNVEEFSRIKGEFSDLFGSSKEIDKVFSELGWFGKTQATKKWLSRAALILGGYGAGKKFVFDPVMGALEGSGGGSEYQGPQ